MSKDVVLFTHNIMVKIFMCKVYPKNIWREHGATFNKRHIPNKAAEMGNQKAVMASCKLGWEVGITNNMLEIKNAALKRWGDSHSTMAASQSSFWGDSCLSSGDLWLVKVTSSSPGAAQNDWPSWNEIMGQLHQNLGGTILQFWCWYFRGHGTINQCKTIWLSSRHKRLVLSMPIVI